MIGRMTESTNKPTLGILVCGYSPDAIIERFGKYNSLFMRLLGEQQFNYISYDVVDSELPGSVHDADAWLITGSKHGVYESHSWIPPLEQLVRDAFAAKVPMAGICFGHQIMSQALGGKVEKFKGGWSVGTVQYTLPTLTGSSEANLNAWHQDQVIEPPEGAQVLGSSENCQFAALKYSDSAVSIQPHPEFDNAYMAMLFQERGDSLPQADRNDGEQSLGGSLDSVAIADWLRSVLTQSSQA